MTFISGQPDDSYFVFQLEVQIENLISLGFTHDYHILVYKPPFRKEWNPLFKKLEEKYKELGWVKMFFYEDDENFYDEIRLIDYVPLQRLWMLEKHWGLFPEMEEEAVFYWDSDVLFTRFIDFNQWLHNDVCYLSYTGRRSPGGNYIDFNYLEGKIQQAVPEKVEELKKLDPIGTLTQYLGLDKSVLRDNVAGSGGAQYLMKNLPRQFWADALHSCKRIRTYLSHLNQEYFPGATKQEKENNGWQSFCSDMWAVLWMLWKYEKETQCPPQLDFAWATEPISAINTNNIYHNAGVSGEIMTLGGVPTVMFYKGKYASNKKSPHQDQHYLSEVDPSYCSHFYVQQLLKVPNPIF